MNKLRKIMHVITILTALGLVLTMTVSQAAWTYIIKNPVKGVESSSAIAFLFPRPLGPLDFTGPRKSESLWGAGYKEGDKINGVEIGADSEHIDKVESTAQSQQNLLVSYTALNLQINSYAETKLLISFEVTFCLAPSLIEGSGWLSYFSNFPFQDPYTIKRNGETIAEGTLYYPNDRVEFEAGPTDVKLEKGDKAFTYSSSRDYYYYTATIDAEQLIAAGAELDINDFIVDPPEPGNEPNYVSFILDIQHTQENTIASFATVKIIATEYPAADSSS